MSDGRSPSPMALPGGLSRSEAVHTLVASFLGWTLDAFDFFVLVFVLPAVARGVPPVGRRPRVYDHRDPGDASDRRAGFRMAGGPLRAARPADGGIILYSVIEVASGLAPSYGWFLVFRALYGIGMGGEWGVGASIAMEAVPSRWRGLLSGLLQEGYAVGYLLAAAAYFLCFRITVGVRCSLSAACRRC